MNCAGIQDLKYEFIEGSLSSADQARVEEHLLGCSNCRRAMQEEQGRAQAVSHLLRDKAEGLVLPSATRARVSRRIDEEGFGTGEVPGGWGFSLPQFLYAGFALSLILAGSLLLIHRKAGLELAKAGAETAGHAVLVHAWQLTPVYIFRKDADRVVDSLTFLTNEVSVTLWTARD